jgi:hypothetical protein
MAVHPRCPCTRASLAELGRLMARSQGRLVAQVLVRAPANDSNSWTRTDLWRAAEAIPGVRAIADPNGAEAAQFGLETSGHVLLYDAAGRLRFSGGITPARGHEGDNAGRVAILAVLDGEDETGPLARHVVFGCALFGHAAERGGGQGK